MALKKILGFVSLAIPFIAMIALIMQNEINFRKYKEYRLQITGYDPVNVLTGHYLSFRYDWPKGIKNTCEQGDECFACFNGARENPDITFVPTKEIEACDATLILENGQPDHNLMEYHIPETQASTLDSMLRNRTAKFEVGIVAYPDHNGQLKDLYIDGKKLAEFFN